jgi:3,4-dihydroxy 2-butanone 4-phosphate synthase/GTP cyclohydrolase II
VWRFCSPKVSYVTDEAVLNVERRAEASIRLDAGEFRAIGYWDAYGAREQVAFVLGDVTSGGGTDVLTRVHSECLTGDAFGSMRCDCGPQLDQALCAIGREGRGVLVYARGHEGRGIGLLNKLDAYRLQDAGADTVDANLALGLPVDARNYGVSAAVLDDLEVASIRLLSNNPDKRAGLEAHGVRVLSMVEMTVSTNPENLRYLATKRDRMGHGLPRWK